jgi:hypothetical protein
MVPDPIPIASPIPMIRRMFFSRWLAATERPSGPGLFNDENERRRQKVHRRLGKTAKNGLEPRRRPGKIQRA